MMDFQKNSCSICVKQNCLSADSHNYFSEIEVSEMSAIKQISQRAHESSNKTVSHQATEHVAQAKTQLFASSATLRRLLLWYSLSFLVT